MGCPDIHYSGLRFVRHRSDLSGYKLTDLIKLIKFLQEYIIFACIKIEMYNGIGKAVTFSI